MQWDIDARCKLGRHVFTIERNYLRSRVRKIVREEAATWAEAVAGIRHVDVDLLDLHLQHVPRLSLCDFDWTSQDMTARPFLFHLLMDIAIVLRDRVRRHAARFHSLN